MIPLHERIGEIPERGLHPTVVIHQYATIATKPFKFPLGPDGKRSGVVATGGIYLDEYVEIFPHANVDRGVYRNTVVGARTKVDHYVHIGHDSIIGKDCCLCAGTIVAGEVEIGDRVTIGIGARILPRVHIGNDCLIGAGAVVTENVPDGVVVVGVPAKIIRKNTVGEGT